MLIAHAVFLLERGQADNLTDARPSRLPVGRRN